MVAGRSKRTRSWKILSFEPYIIREIMSARLRWLRYVKRMPAHKTVKRVHMGCPSGRPVDRRKYRWRDEAVKGLRKELGGHRTRLVALVPTRIGDQDLVSEPAK